MSLNKERLEKKFAEEFARLNEKQQLAVKLLMAVTPAKHKDWLVVSARYY